MSTTDVLMMLRKERHKIKDQIAECERQLKALDMAIDALAPPSRRKQRRQPQVTTRVNKGVRPQQVLTQLQREPDRKFTISELAHTFDASYSSFRNAVWRLVEQDAVTVTNWTPATGDGGLGRPECFGTA